ncbi:nuclear transport factor 2 family protein [Streptomonospora nanhaiensis]|uniref:nuclear transport factor 2 family protein n=1 Tax=Streptomonospora nanhaiensis TaxID=1323731 RepID=UPI001C380D48|nr:nuclear transport factor 2 family protein [Streptomonospora nanhaiensis]MBV2365248.1 nuclear transport factor 2 family protein [Streptomonospora nanhaiensis]MBX9390298.1 nuclear transport factor 2 family protein [Streptomonospora nanhaiensis]
MPTTSQQVAPETVSRVRQFYAEQMQLIDDGDVAGWAATFTEDAVFSSNGLPAPGHGRAAIEAGALRAAAERRARGARHRHVQSALAVRDAGAGTLRCRSYVTVVETLPGAPPVLVAQTVLEDELVLHGGEPRVRARTVVRDDLR